MGSDCSVVCCHYSEIFKRNGFGSVLHLIGNKFEEDEVLCGPQMDIQRVACTVVDSNNGYEFRKYLESEVNFGVGFGDLSFTFYS